MKSFGRTMASLVGTAILLSGWAGGRAAAQGPDLSGTWKSNAAWMGIESQRYPVWQVQRTAAGYSFFIPAWGVPGTMTQTGNSVRVTMQGERVFGSVDGQVETDPATGAAVHIRLARGEVLSRQGGAPGATQPPPPPPIPTFRPAIEAPPPANPAPLPPRVSFGPAIEAPPPPIDEPPIDEPPIDEPLPPPPPPLPPPPPTNWPPPNRPPFILPPLPELLFGATDPDALVKGRYYAVNPDGSTGAVLGTFTVYKDIFKMFPAGGDEIQVAVNDAPMGGVLATDYAHYATPPVDPLVVHPKANGGVRLGPDRQNTPHDYYSRSSGTLNFMLGGPTLDADMQQLYRTVAPEGFARTIEERSQPARIRFIPDSFGVITDE